MLCHGSQLLGWKPDIDWTGASNTLIGLHPNRRYFGCARTCLRAMSPESRHTAKVLKQAGLPKQF
jgi:hypothetical protein